MEKKHYIVPQLRHIKMESVRMMASTDELYVTGNQVDSRRQDFSDVEDDDSESLFGKNTINWWDD